MSTNYPPRFEYLDILKGFAILLVVWYHSISSPDWGHWNLGTLANILFFFISGLMFKTLPFKDFIITKSIRLLIPFLGFYIIAIPFQFIVDIWDHHSINAFNWYRIFDIFKIDQRCDYLSLYVPLWFILALFIIQLISNFLFNLSKPIILVTALLPLLFKNQILSWPTLFMFNNSLYWYSYFAIGYLLGKSFASFLAEKRRSSVFIFVFSIILLIVILFLINFIDTNYDSNHLIHLSYFAFIIVMMSGFSILKLDLIKFHLLQFLGTHSLEILCMHIFTLVPVGRIYMKIFPKEYLPFEGLIVSILSIIFLIPLVKILHQYLPFLIGKRKILKT